MKRLSNILLIPAALLALANLASGPSCVIGGRGEGVFNLLVTNSPQDDWREVSILLKSVQAYNNSTNDWLDIWTADPAHPESGKLDLAALGGAPAILGSATVPGGTYDQVLFTIDPSPATMTFIDASGLTVPPGDIIVADPGGNGEILLDLDPPVRIIDKRTGSLPLIFDLANPLSITRVDGKVVLNLQFGQRALPADPGKAQIARTLGDLTAAAGDGSSFGLRSVQGVDVVFDVDAATTYHDADAGQPGSFAGLTALVDQGSVFVDSEIASGGRHYARTVWYGAEAAALADFTPEGLVRQTGPDRLIVSRLSVEEPAAGRYLREFVLETILVDADTVWTFKGLEMGTGLSLLPFLAEGYRIEVTLVDASAATRVAASIDVTSASESGIVASASLQSFVFGDSADSGIQAYSAVASHAFEWQLYALEASRSSSVQAFVAIADKAAASGFRLGGLVSLFWDGAATRWVVEELVLVPVRLHEQTRITTGYSGTSGTMELSTFDPWDGVAPVDLTVSLDTGGELPTLAGSLVVDGGTGSAVYTFPVPAGDWASLFVPALDSALISLRPDVATDGTLTWHVFTILARRTTP